MIFVALNEAADRGELLLVTDGLCRFHKRRDGVVVIRELLVLPFRRRTGVGKALLGMVRERHPEAVIQAKCPAGYESNGFWRHLGFEQVNSGENNVWQLRPSSTAPTAIRPSPAPQ